MKSNKLWLAGALTLGLASAVVAAPPQGLGKGMDLGPAAAFAENSQVTVTVALALSNRAEMEQLIESVSTPGNPQFRQFLTPEQFRARFGPSAAAVDAVTRSFLAQGLTVTRTATAQLHVTGTAAQIERAFAVQLHAFVVPATDTTSGYRYRAPLADPRVPEAIAPLVHGVLGLDTRPAYAPHLSPVARGQAPARMASSTNTPDPPGAWTVIDYADYYDVTPLYERGLTGRGQTLAIVTLASFTQSDAYYYWKTLGLDVAQDRITEIQIDGGSGPPSDDSGSSETTVDVEQSGGLAPGARILVYEAPNSSQGLVDALAAAVDTNSADTVSTSWGLWELFNSANPFGNGPITDPVTGQMTTILAAQHDVFAQAALLGQSLFCSSGDFGAYDSVNSLPTAPSPGQPFSFNPVLSIDSPASDPFITAAGGTTLPGSQIYDIPPSSTVTLDVAHEQAWGWDYLGPLCVATGAPADCGYPTGTGGGVSVYFARPFYQFFAPGMARSAADQSLYQLTPPPAELIAALPGGYFGRNVPDLSTNADPQTGYLLYYTSNVNGFEIFTLGGTSFVAPQMNGITSLFVQGLRHRVGLLNPALYFIAATDQGGRDAPLRPVRGGDNWFWFGHPGYSQATGVGIPDQANLFEALRQLER